VRVLKGMKIRANLVRIHLFLLFLECIYISVLRNSIFEKEDWYGLYTNISEWKALSIFIRVRAAYLSSVIVIISLETK